MHTGASSVSLTPFIAVVDRSINTSTRTNAISDTALRYCNVIDECVLIFQEETKKQKQPQEAVMYSFKFAIAFGKGMLENLLVGPK